MLKNDLKWTTYSRYGGVAYICFSGLTCGEGYISSGPTSLPVLVNTKFSGIFTGGYYIGIFVLRQYSYIRVYSFLVEVLINN